MVFQLVITNFRIWNSLQTVCKQWYSVLQKYKKHIFAPLTLDFFPHGIKEKDLVLVRSMVIQAYIGKEYEWLPIIKRMNTSLLKLKISGFSVLLTSMKVPLSLQYLNLSRAYFPNVENHPNLTSIEVSDVFTISLEKYLNVPELTMFTFRNIGSGKIERVSDWKRWPKLKKVSIFDSPDFITQALDMFQHIDNLELSLMSLGSTFVFGSDISLPGLAKLTLQFGCSDFYYHTLAPEFLTQHPKLCEIKIYTRDCVENHLMRWIPILNDSGFETHYSNDNVGLEELFAQKIKPNKRQKT